MGYTTGFLIYNLFRANCLARNQTPRSKFAYFLLAEEINTSVKHFPYNVVSVFVVAVDNI